MTLQASYDPSRIVSLEVVDHGAVDDAAESTGGDVESDAGVKTPVAIENFEDLYSMLLDSGTQLWAWVDSEEADAEDSKYAGETFWFVLQDTAYVTWIYTSAKTRPVCWKAFREFRQKVLHHEAYVSLIGYYKSEQATLKALNEYVENHVSRLQDRDLGGDVDSEAAEMPDHVMEDEHA